MLPLCSINQSTITHKLQTHKHTKTIKHKSKSNKTNINTHIIAHEQLGSTEAEAHNQLVSELGAHTARLEALHYAAGARLERLESTIDALQQALAAQREREAGREQELDAERKREVDNNAESSEGVEEQTRPCAPPLPHRMAILVPYIESQTDKLLDLVAQWRRTPPFESGGSVAPERAQIDLILYYHRSEAIHRSFNGSIETILDALPQRNASHFDSERVRFLYANLTDAEDEYPQGANHMFYNLFLKPEFHEPLAEKYKVCNFLFVLFLFNAFLIVFIID